MPRCDTRASRSWATLAALALLCVVSVTASAADDRPVWFEGRVQWIAGSTTEFTNGQGWVSSKTPGMPTVTGFNGLHTGLQYQLFVDPQREMMALAGLNVSWAHTGRVAALGAPDFTTVTPAFAFGKGRALYAMYQARLKTLNAADFGDLLLAPIAILRANREILEEYQSRFRYMLVDEYQDTNVAQYLWLRLLAGANKNLCVVGDDDQSI